MPAHVLVARAWAAHDELLRWSNTREHNATVAQAAQFDLHTGAHVVFDNEREHANAIRCFAFAAIEEHQRYNAYLNRSSGDHTKTRQKNLDAIAAWRLVSRTVSYDEMSSRLVLAIEASTRCVPRCGRILHPEQWE